MKRGENMKTEKEKMIKGERYYPGDKELVKDRARARVLVRSFKKDNFLMLEIDYKIKMPILHELNKG
jgi:maltose O-acetyltransferase